MVALTERLRWQRAQQEDIHLARVTDAVYRVESESGKRYVIDVEHRECSCPDHIYRGVSCKYLLKAVQEGAYAR